MSKIPVVLIVDDDEMNITMAKTILEMKVPAQYLTANSGQGCLDALIRQKGRVDLILLDIAMPGMDGLETLAAIRKDAALKNIPVIFLTAAADRATIVRASQLKIAGYVKKPFVPDDLVARVDKQLHPPMPEPQFDDPEVNDLFKALDKLGL